MNAKKELLKELEQAETTIECAKIISGGFYGGKRKNIILKKGYSDSEYKEFLNQLDFEYDNGFGVQELWGNVWLNDGTWLERSEYDGNEQWNWKFRPNIPKELLKEEKCTHRIF